MRARSGTIRFIETYHDPDRSTLVARRDTVLTAITAVSTERPSTSSYDQSITCRIHERQEYPTHELHDNSVEPDQPGRRPWTTWLPPNWTCW